MSLSKKYVYVHQCSLAKNTPDNFRKVLGRAWVDSTASGLQYGYDVSPPVMRMTYGPYFEWAHDYFKATELPAITQIVSITPNPHYFPAIDNATVDIGDQGTATAEGDPCCGWDAYLGRNFKNHFSTGNPLQIVKQITDTRSLSFEKAIQNMKIRQYRDPYFPDDNCLARTTGAPGTTDTPGTDRPSLDRPLASMSGGLQANDTGTATLEPVPRPLVQTTSPVLFRDLWFQIMTPLSQIEDKNFEDKEFAMPSDLTFNYNFYLAAYEEQLQGNRLSEVKIPNLYLTVAKDGSIPYVLYLKNNIACRFKDFEKLVLQKGFREYLFPIKQQPFLQDKNEYSTSFPMDATISFGTDRSTFVADALEDSKLESSMLRRCSEGEILLGDSTSAPEGVGTPITPMVTAYTDSTARDYTPPQDNTLKFKYAKRYGKTTATQKTLSTTAADRPLRTFDFYQWMMSLPDLPSSTVTLPNDHVFLGNPNDSTDMALKVGLYQQNMSFLANYFILSGKINEIAKTHLRTYQQMMRGDTPHSETILYRISKYSTAELNRALDIDLTTNLMERDEILLGSDTAPALSGEYYEKVEAGFDRIYTNNIEPIQNIWIPNSNSIDVVEYVDTQVKYNKGYTYTVTAYELSVGTEYFYSQYSQKPEPEYCDDKDGVISVTVPYVEKDMQSILMWFKDTTLSEAEKYSNIMRQIQTQLDPSFTCEGTGIGILSKTDYYDGLQYAASTKYIIYCFCNDDSRLVSLLRDQEGYLMGPAADFYDASSSGDAYYGAWYQHGYVLNVSTTTDDREKACRIYAQIQRTLKREINVLREGPETAAMLKLAAALGIRQSISSVETKKSRFKVESCPESWTGGKMPTRTVTGGYREVEGGIETVYLGEIKVDAVCECPPLENPCTENFMVTTIPSLKVHEVPYMIWSGKVTDSYPVGPDVEINPYRAVNNEMLFMIGAGLGEYYGRPVPITPRDKTLFNELLDTQKSKDGQALFKSDDPVQNFEMFKLTEKPRKYTDFAKGERRQFSVKVKGSPGQQADAVSFIEQLTPNVKYYYIFRSRDIHDHISNPTPIYEVELVDSDGAIYPLINIYEPDPDLAIDLSKQGQRLLQIRPEFLQSVIDEEASGLLSATSAGTPSGLAIGEVKLGARDIKLWDKKFKLRLTSCETRKMLDINLRFNTEHLTSDDCQPSNTDKTLVDSNSKNGLDVPDDIPIPGSAADKTGSTDTDKSSSADTGSSFSSDSAGAASVMGSSAATVSGY